MTPTLENINAILKTGFTGVLGLEITEITSDTLTAKAPISAHSHRPSGFVHGGVYLALAESMAGTGSFLYVDIEKYEVFGIQVSANHTGSAQSGDMKIVATCLHRGRQTHIWNVDIFNDADKRLSTARITNMIVKKS